MKIALFIVIMLIGIAAWSVAGAAGGLVFVLGVTLLLGGSEWFNENESHLVDRSLTRYESAKKFAQFLKERKQNQEETARD